MTTHNEQETKILTIAALVVFCAIIFFHYFPEGKTASGGIGIGYFTSNALIEDVRMPLFVLAVLYTGLFFVTSTRKG